LGGGFVILIGMNKHERILLIGASLWNFADGMLGPLLAVFTARVGGDILDVSWAWSIYLIVTGVAVIFVGKYSDKHDKAFLLTLGYALTTIFTFSYLFVENPIHLFIVQAGLGLALALSNPTWSALYDQYSNDKQNGYLWGRADGQMKIATGLAILIGGFVVNNYSFEVLFIMMGCMQLVTTVYQAQMLRHSKRAR